MTRPPLTGATCVSPLSSRSICGSGGAAMMSTPPRAQLGRARAGVLDDAEDQALGIHGAPPVVRVRLQHELLVALPLDHLVGAGADRLLREGLGAGRFPRALGQDVAAHHVEQRAGQRPLGDDVHRVLVAHLDLGDALGERGPPVGGHDVGLERVADVFGVHGLAVRELDVLAQVEAPRGRVDVLPALGQQRDRASARRPPARSACRTCARGRRRRRRARSRPDRRSRPPRRSPPSTAPSGAGCAPASPVHATTIASTNHCIMRISPCGVRRVIGRPRGCGRGSGRAVAGP